VAFRNYRLSRLSRLFSNLNCLPVQFYRSKTMNYPQLHQAIWTISISSGRTTNCTLRAVRSRPAFRHLQYSICTHVKLEDSYRQIKMWYQDIPEEEYSDAEKMVKAL